MENIKRHFLDFLDSPLEEEEPTPEELSNKLFLTAEASEIDRGRRV